MSDNAIVPGEPVDEMLDSESLPTFVARKWGFPLQSYEVEESTFYSIKDWIAGLTGSTRPGHTWENFRDRHKENPPLTKGMSYAMSDGRIFTMDFTIDEGLFRIAGELKITKMRPALKAIKEFLAKAGVFVDQARRDPEGAAERLAIARQQRGLKAGKPAEWISTREQAVLTRKQFVSQILALIQNKRSFGPIIASLTNDVYRGMFASDASGLRTRLGITSKQTPRDHFTTIALAYTTIAEETIRIHLSNYNDRDSVPVPVIRDVVQTLADTIGVQVDTIANALQIDPVSGRALSEAPLTKAQFHRILDRGAQPKKGN